MEEEKKVNENDSTQYEIVSLCELYNLQQQYIDLYDLRESNKYKLHHIEDATNIPDPVKFDKFCEDYDLPIVIYGDSNIMTTHLCDRLFQIAKTQNREKRFAVFKGDYIQFFQKYKFLCESVVYNEEAIIYPSMIIEDKLYLGDIHMATNKDILKNLNITHIINVCNFQTNKAKIEYLQIGIEDKSTASISTYFDEANEFINKTFKENNQNTVFVHCMQGQSRSASIIISYLMKTKGYSLIDAYLYTKKCRPRTAPNTGFYQELIEYEKKLFNKSTKDELEKALQLKKWAFNYFSGTWDMS